jgi:hypothetical protein
VCPACKGLIGNAAYHSLGEKNFAFGLQPLPDLVETISQIANCHGDCHKLRAS